MPCCGFVVEGRSRESIFRDGRWWDELAMSVLETDHRRARAGGDARAGADAVAAAGAAGEPTASPDRGRVARRTPEVLRRTIRRFT
jgi:hypothetical protein